MCLSIDVRILLLRGFTYMVCASRSCWNIVLCCAIKKAFFSCGLSAVGNLFRFPCGRVCRWCSFEFFDFGKFTLTALQFSFNCLQNDKTREEMCWRRNVFSSVFYNFSSKRYSSCKHLYVPLDTRESVYHILVFKQCARNIFPTLIQNKIGQNLKKTSIKYHGNPFNTSRNVKHVQKDGKSHFIWRSARMRTSPKSKDRMIGYYWNKHWNRH